MVGQNRPTYNATYNTSDFVLFRSVMCLGTKKLLIC